MRGKTVFILAFIAAFLPLADTADARPTDPTRTYQTRRLFSWGYAAVELDGSFILVYHDDRHDPAEPYAYVRWANNGFSLDRWRGNSSWNRDSQYTCVRVPPWFVRRVWPFPIPFDPE